VISVSNTENSLRVHSSSFADPRDPGTPDWEPLKKDVIMPENVWVMSVSVGKCVQCWKVKISISGLKSKDASSFVLID
jgi:hypothetical protein